MSTLYRSDLADLYASRLPYIDHIIGKIIKEWPEEYSRYCRVKSSRRMTEQTTGVSGFGYLSTKNEGSSVTLDKVTALPSRNYTHVTYALGYEVSMEAAEDDLDASIQRLAPALAFSSRATVERVTIDNLNNGFTTATANPRGEALFSTTHASVAAGSLSNYLSPTAELGVTSMQSVLTLLEDTKNERGLPMMMLGRTLFVPTALAWSAERLLASPDHPETADRAVNPLRRNRMQYVVLHYLSSTTHWFVQAEKEQTEMWFYWRKPFTTAHDTDSRTLTGLTTIVGRFSSGWSDWRGWAAS
jgi:hypothetical protein